MVAPKRKKDGMPKKHDPKKREEEREKEVAMSQKKERRKGCFKRENQCLNEYVASIHPSIHPSTHPLIHLHLLIEIAWLVSPWILSLTLQYMKCKYALFLSYLELHKGFLAVGKTEGRYCPGNKIQDERLKRELSWELCHVFKNLSKSTSRWIADLWTSKYYSMHHSNSQQPKTRRQLKSPHEGVR